VARLATALLRFVDATRVWLLATARTNGTMAINGMRAERMELCHGWWRLSQRRFCVVSCLFVVFLSCSCSTRQCVLCCACFLLLWSWFTARHCVARLVTALLRLVDAALVWLLATARMNGVMATNGLRDERMQCCHGRWRLLQHCFFNVSCFVCGVFVLFLLDPLVCVVLCVLSFVVVMLLGTALRGASRHGVAAVC